MANTQRNTEPPIVVMKHVQSLEQQPNVDSSQTIVTQAKTEIVPAPVENNQFSPLVQNTVGTSALALATQPVKKKRGRPRKNQVKNTISTFALATRPIQKKRGRPRKDQQPLVRYEKFESVEDTVALARFRTRVFQNGSVGSDVTSALATQPVMKKRGRPKKAPRSTPKKKCPLCGLEAKSNYVRLCPGDGCDHRWGAVPKKRRHKNANKGTMPASSAWEPKWKCSGCGTRKVYSEFNSCEFDGPHSKHHRTGISQVCIACQKKEEGESVTGKLPTTNKQSVVRKSIDADSTELDGFVINSTESACPTSPSAGRVRWPMTWTAPSAPDVLAPLEGYPTLVQYYDKLKNAGYDCPEAITTAGKEGLLEDVPGMKPGHARLIIHLFTKNLSESSCEPTNIKKIPSGQNTETIEVEPMDGAPSRVYVSL